MKKLKSVSIFGQPVKIKWVKRMPVGHDHMAAFYDLDKKHIVICEMASKEQLSKTLTHEIIHAYAHRMGFYQEASLLPFMEVIAESLSHLIYELYDFR